MTDENAQAPEAAPRRSGYVDECIHCATFSSHTSRAAIGGWECVEMVSDGVVADEGERMIKKAITKTKTDPRSALRDPLHRTKMHVYPTPN